MSEYLPGIIDRFDPFDHLSGDLKEVAEERGLDVAMTVVRSPHESRDEGGEAILIWHILLELHELSGELHDSLEKVENRPHHRWCRKERTSLDEFFTFSGIVLEYHLRQAFFRKLVADDRRTDDLRKTIFGADNNNRGMSAYQCQEYLYNSNIIDNSLKGLISQTRRHRNQTVHHLYRWIFADFDPIPMSGEIRRAEKATVRLLEATYDIDLE